MEATAEELFASNLKGIGPAKIKTLSDQVVERLATLYGVAGVDSRRSEILGAKEARKKAEKQAPVPVPALPVDLGDDGHTPVSTVCAPAPAPSGAGFEAERERPWCSVVSFNALKLRIFEMRDEWEGAFRQLCRHDVILLSEVPAGTAAALDRKVREVKALAGDEFRVLASLPSGPGNLESHLALVRSSEWKVIKTQTQEEANSVRLSHAPFSLLLERVGRPDRPDRPDRVVVTSVHFPPSGTKTRSLRDQQIRAFLQAYKSVSDTRFGQPLASEGVVHVVAGDFNASATDLEEALRGGGMDSYMYTCFGNLSTSSGGKSYDNILLNKDARHRFTSSTKLLRPVKLQNSRLGRIGLSDHAALSLALDEEASAGA